jgi:hypothetical protein
VILNGTAPQTGSFNVTGNSQVGGNLFVGGTLQIGVTLRDTVSGLICKNYDLDAGITTGTPHYTECSCQPGEAILTGGAWTGNGSYIRESQPVGTSTWRAACQGVTGFVDVQCGGFTLLCARLGF